MSINSYLLYGHYTHKIKYITAEV